MNKCKINIWGRDFELPVNYDCFPGEDVLDSQVNALSLLIESPTVIDESFNSVESYIFKNAPNEVVVSIDNIFKYVMPKSIFIPRSGEQISIAIMCDYKFDPEHGLAVIFESGKFKAVGEQDVIL